jgi:hypothetical protein
MVRARGVRKKEKDVLMRATMVTVTLGVLLLGSSGAHAAPAGQSFWSSNGAGCVPGDPAIQSDRYFITAGSVNYRAGGSGLVTLYCPVTAGTIVHQAGGTVGAWPWCPSDAYVFRLTYTDSDGTDNAVSVASQLIRLSKFNGAFAGAVPGATLSSNSSSETLPTNLSTGFVHTFEFQNFYYYVRVDMNRAVGTPAIATFYGAALDCR